MWSLNRGLSIRVVARVERSETRERRGRIIRNPGFRSAPSGLRMLGAIKKALDSDEALSSLIRQSRDEDAVRAYLVSMQKVIMCARVVA